MMRRRSDLIAHRRRAFARGAAMLRRFCVETRGATSIEYAMIASLIGGVIASTVWSFGSSLKTTFYDRLAGMF